MTVAYLGLGSNMGDRAQNLSRACRLLGERDGIVVEARSPLYASQSVEGGGPDDFLNAALRVRTTLDALELLQAARGVEAALGRPQPPRHGARPIDIDILLFGDQTIEQPDLRVPHPRMLHRAFVLRPLCDVLEGGWFRPAGEDWKVLC